MGLFYLEIDIYASPESFPLTYGLLGQGNIRYNHLEIRNPRAKFLAMHITNQKLSFTVGNLLNIFTEHDLYLIS